MEDNLNKPGIPPGIPPDQLLPEAPTLARTNWRKIILSVLLGFTLIAALIFIGIWVSKRHASNQEMTSIQPTPTIAPVKKYSGEFSIYRVENGEKVLVVNTALGDEDTNTGGILRWKDNLIFGLKDRFDIQIHDINSGETEVLVKSADLYSNFSGKISPDMRTRGLSLSAAPILVEDTLFFSFGEYLIDGGSYWLDLNTSRNPVLFDKDDSAIEKVGNIYWKKSCFGDGAIYRCTYSIFDVQKKSVTRSYSFKNGNDLLLIDSDKDRFIVISYDEDLMKDPYWEGETNKTLKAINYLTGEMIVLVSKEDFPIENSRLIVDELCQRIYIYNAEKLYFYDIKNEKMNFLGDFSNINNVFTLETDQNKACVYLLDQQKYKQLIIDPAGGLPLNDQECSAARAKDYLLELENKNIINRAKMLFEGLNLPSNYTYTIE